MSHRLAFPPNLPVPIATKLSAAGDGRVTPLHPRAQAPSFDGQTHLFYLQDDPERSIVLANDASIELLALDQTPLDPIDDSPSDDLLWVKASFVDPLGRRVELAGGRPVPDRWTGQCFGGVATQQAQPLLTRTATRPNPRSTGSFSPSSHGPQYEIRIEGDVTDSAVVGAIQLVQADTNTLRLTLFPRSIGLDGKAHASPIHAAEELGVAGWCIQWEHVDFLQVPIMTVRAERGDTLTKIAKEMSVDADSVIRANSDLAGPDEPLGGELVNVPFIVRAATTVARRVHSTALTWKEIIRGWTTLN